MMLSDQSTVAQQPVTSPSENITCQQPNKGQIAQQIHLPQNQTNVTPVVTMSSFLSSSLAVQPNIGTQSQVTLPFPPETNEVSSVPVLTPINSQSASSSVMPITPMQLGLVHKSVPSASNSDSETIIQTVNPTTKVTTVPLQASPASKTLEMVSVNIPVISTNTTGLAENWTNLPQPQNLSTPSHPQQRTNVTPSILPINVLQRFLNVTGVIATNDTSANTTATVSIPTTSSKYVCKKNTSTANTFVCNPILPSHLGQDQQVPVTSLMSENYSILSTPHLKLTPSSSDPAFDTSLPSTVCVTETSSSGQLLLPIQSIPSKDGTKVTNVLIGDTNQQYINCNTTAVMFQTSTDVELLQLVPLSVPQAGSEDSSGQTGTITTLTTSHKSLLTSAEQSRTATTATGVTTNLS